MYPHDLNNMVIQSSSLRRREQSTFEASRAAMTGFPPMYTGSHRFGHGFCDEVFQVVPTSRWTEQRPLTD